VGFVTRCELESSGIGKGCWRREVWGRGQGDVLRGGIGMGKGRMEDSCSWEARRLGGLDGLTCSGARGGYEGGGGCRGGREWDGGGGGF